MSVSEIHSVLVGCAYLSNYIDHKEWHLQFIEAMQHDKVTEALKMILCKDFYLAVLKVVFPNGAETSSFVDILVENSVISNQSWLVSNLSGLICETHLFHTTIHSNVVAMILNQLFKFDADEFTESILSGFPEFSDLKEYPLDLQQALNLFLSLSSSKEIIDFNISIEEIQQLVGSFLNCNVKFPYFQDLKNLTEIEKKVLCLMISDPFAEYVTRHGIEIELASSQDSMLELTGPFQECQESEKPVTAFPEIIPVSLQSNTLVPVVLDLNSSREDKRQDSKATMDDNFPSNFEIFEEYHKPQYSKLPDLKREDEICDFDKMVSELDQEILTMGTQGKKSKLIFIDIDGSSKDHTTYLEERSTRRERLLQKLKKVTQNHQKRLCKKMVVSVNRISLPKLNTKTLIKNALFVMLAGSMAEDSRYGALQSLEKSASDYHVISMKDEKNHAYRALYRVENINLIVKIHGSGPQQVGSENVSHFYKFDCGAKRFREISQPSSNEFHASVHGIVINRK